MHKFEGNEMAFPKMWGRIKFLEQN